VLRIGILVTKISGPVMRNTLLVTASEYRFISEIGIVAVLGDEDQFVKGNICEINRPLSFERGIWIKSGAMAGSAPKSG